MPDLHYKLCLLFEYKLRHTSVRTLFVDLRWWQVVLHIIVLAIAILVVLVNLIVLIPSIRRRGRHMEENMSYFGAIAMAIAGALGRPTTALFSPDR